jgi:quercetin dioxygenase-like cupin family protein
VSAFGDIGSTPALQIWDGIVGRTVESNGATLAVVELDPGGHATSHSHPNEQVGVLIEGNVRFTIGDETRELGPGGSWSIPADTAHEVVAGPEGAVIVEVFVPGRSDWGGLEQVERAPRWPRA